MQSELKFPKKKLPFVKVRNKVARFLFLALQIRHVCNNLELWSFSTLRLKKSKKQKTFFFLYDTKIERGKAISRFVNYTKYFSIFGPSVYTSSGKSFYSIMFSINSVLLSKTSHTPYNMLEGIQCSESFFYAD